MNVAELLIKMVLDPAGLKSGAAEAERSLHGVEQNAAAAGNAVDKAGADGARSMHKLDKAANTAKQSMGKLADYMGGQLLGVIKSVGGAIAAVWSVGAIKSAVTDYLSAADALGKYADSLGVAVEDVQAWEEAVKHAGGSAEGFRQSLQSMTGSLTAIAATGEGRMLPFLEQLGIKAKDSTGKVKDAMQLLPELAEKFEKMSAAQAAGFGEKLGIDKGTVMLLQQGRKATEEAIKAGKERTRFTKEDTEAAAKANDAIQDMQRSLQAFVTRAIAPLIPAITKLAELIDRAGRWMQENGRAIALVVGIIAAAITTMLLPTLISMASAAAAAAAPFLPMIAAAVALGLALEDLWTFVEGGESAFEVLIRSMGATDQQVELVRGSLRALWGIVEQVWEALKSLATFDGGGFVAAIRGMYDQAAAAVEKMLAVFDVSENVINGVGAVIRKVGDVAAGVFELFGSLFSLDGSVILNALQALWQKVKDLGALFSNLLGMIASKLAGLLPGWAQKLLGVGGGGAAPAAQTQPLAVHAGSSGAAAGNTTNNVENSTNIGQVTVNTQATDAQGIARDLGPALRNQAAQADGAYGT